MPRERRGGSLRLRKHKKSPNWYLRGTIRGIYVDESVGTSDRRAAEEILTKRQAEILERSVHGIRATATFAEAAVAYLEQGGERRYMVPILQHLGLIMLAQIGQAEIDATAAHLYPAAGPATRNRQVYTPIVAVLNFAAKRGLTVPQKIERPKQPAGRVRSLTTGEAEKLIDACSDHLRPLVIFLLGTGARLSEALYLNWRQVDLVSRRVQFLVTKNGERRGVPLNDRVVLELANLPNRDDEVFRRPDGKPYTRLTKGGGQIKTAFNGACRRAGISDFTPHDCRHTWATWLYAETRNIPALKQLGGWKSEQMVMRYSHVNPDHLADVIDAIPWGNTGDHQRPVPIKADKSSA